MHKTYGTSASVAGLFIFLRTMNLGYRLKF